MKKIVSILLIVALGLSFAACGKEEQDVRTDSSQQNKVQQSDAAHMQEGNLTLLCDDSSSFSNHFGTENGFYYFTECKDIADGICGMHLMYVDYATKQEVYLCSDSGCRHNSDECSSVFVQGEFGEDSLPFVWGDSLYVLNRNYDSDGSVSIDMTGGAVSPEAEEVTLYRMNLDGSSRQKIYTFPDNLTTEKIVIGDGDSLWFVTKRLAVQNHEAENYTTSTERSLSKYSISDNKIVDHISLDLDDGIYQTVIGAVGNKFILNGVAYPEGKSDKEIMKLTDDEWKEIYKNSSTVYSSLETGSKSKTEIYRMNNETLRSTCAVRDGFLFVSNCADGGVLKINPSNGEKTTLATLEQNYIYTALKDTLCCIDTGKTDDQTLYFVDLQTGEVHHSSLTNKSLGWQMDILADAGDQVLVVYDYDAVKDGEQYIIKQYKYALISKDDLYNSRANYMPIAMEGSGI